MKKLNRVVFFSALFIAWISFTGCKGEVEQGQQTQSGQNSAEKNYFDYENQDFGITNVSEDTKDGRKLYTWNYKTIDQKGNQIECSSFLEYPAPSGTGNQQIDVVVIDCHGTIFSDSQAPSKQKYPDIGSCKMISGKNVLIIAPDYIGYGASSAKEHPYMIADLNARTIIDAALSALKNKSTFKFDLKNGCQTVISGFSQGGQTSLATFRAIQDKIPSELENLINVKKCYSGAGPYDLVATMNTYLEEWDDAISPLIYLVVKGVLSAEYDFLKDYTIEDFMTQEFLDSNLRQGIDAKNITMTSIASDPTLGSEYLKFRDKTKLLTPEALNPGSSVNKALKKALALNNLSTGWTVKKELYIYHHKQDDMVPFVNYTNIMNGIGKSSFVTSCADTTEITINPSNPADFIHGKSSNVFHNVIRQELGQ